MQHPGGTCTRTGNQIDAQKRHRPWRLFLVPTLLLVCIVLVVLRQFFPFTKLDSFALEKEYKPKPSANYVDAEKENEQSLYYSGHDTEITTTNYGWFHPNPYLGMTNIRCMAMKHFTDAIVAHERYNFRAWRDLDRNPSPNRTIIAFLDIDVCQLLHWPIFGGWLFNSDSEGGRKIFKRTDYSKVCPTVDTALKSPALAAPDSRLVVLSCIELSIDNFPCLRADRTNISDLYSKLVVGHLSAIKKKTHALDFGLPPWPVKTVALNETQIQEIQNIQICENSTSRSLFFSFVGRPRIFFPEFHEYLKPLHGSEGIHAVFGWKHYAESPHPDNIIGLKAVGPVAPENQSQDEFYTLLQKSIFVGAPVGDCPYTVRFSEILSSGAIPVVYSDNWVLPYNRDVVPDWSEILVLIPQRRVNETMSILRAIPHEKRCRMSQNGYQFYQNYVADSTGRLKAVLQIMDAALSRRRRMRDFDIAPVEFSAAPDRRRLL